MIVPGSANPLLMGGVDGYQISRSVRLRSSASAYFNRTPASAGNQQKWTWSAWVKFGSFTSGAGVRGVALLFGNLRTSNYTMIGLNPADSGASYQFGIESVVGTAGGSCRLYTTAVLRDPSAWYHLLISVDTTQATAANRILIYVNGVSQAITTVYTPAQNLSMYINENGASHGLGATYTTSYGNFDGEMTEVNFIDGQQLTPSSFGTTDSVTGVWNPIRYSGTYGTNGFYLNFSDNSGNTATTIGKDYSGNGNNWTPNNISVTAGTTYDSMVDVPIGYGSDTGAGGEVRGNYCVLNPIDNRGGNTTSDGNLKVGPVAGTWKVQPATIAVSSGKWYFEAVQTVFSNGGYFACGFVPVPTPVNSYTNLPSSVASAQGWSFQLDVNSAMYFWYNYTTAPQYVTISSGFTTSDVAQIAVDIDAGKIWVGKNNTWYDSSGGTTGNPTTGANPTASNISGTIVPFLASGNTTPTGYANFGQRAFSYTAPSGFKALCTQNLPTPSISNGANYMAATLWTGTGVGSRAITNTSNGVSFQPDWVWIKSRSATYSHQTNDSVRGATNGCLYTDLTNAVDANFGITSFNSDGFTLGNTASLISSSFASQNGSGATYVGWQWKASGSTVSNTSGSITSTVSANTTSGFSVVTWTGTGSNATVGHGLGVAPKMIINKPRNAADNWISWHTTLGATGYIYLNLTNASNTGATVWNSTLPTSTVFSVGTSSNVNTNGQTMVSYCFAEVAGYSAFGSYTGNGSTDGPFVYCGFRPRWILLRESSGAQNWIILDTSRNTYNAPGSYLLPNTGGNEGTLDPAIDILSNGFKMRTNSGGWNTSSATMIYAAFAENPFTIARAR